MHRIKFQFGGIKLSTDGLRPGVTFVKKEGEVETTDVSLMQGFSDVSQKLTPTLTSINKSSN